MPFVARFEAGLGGNVLYVEPERQQVADVDGTGSGFGKVEHAHVADFHARIALLPGKSPGKCGFHVRFAVQLEAEMVFRCTAQGLLVLGNKQELAGLLRQAFVRCARACPQQVLKPFLRACKRQRRTSANPGVSASLQLLALFL